jgi:hypothetical protein
VPDIAPTATAWLLAACAGTVHEALCQVAADMASRLQAGPSACCGLLLELLASQPQQPAVRQQAWHVLLLVASHQDGLALMPG